jgi:hypothetical protein
LLAGEVAAAVQGAMVLRSRHHPRVRTQSAFQ